jgi:arylsulfatase A-like enzyme
VDPHKASHRGATGPATVAAVRRWLTDAGPEPLFLFIHLFDVHYDYTPPAEYVALFDPDYEGSLDGSGFEDNPAVHAEMPARDLEHLIALYDGEVRFTDDVLAAILSLPEAEGRLERALVAVTSDHGDEFFEHGDTGHQRTLFDEVVRIPLVLRWPGHIDPGIAIREQVRLIDVMPTVLSLVGVPAPDRLQGRDLSPALRGDPLKRAGALLELQVRGRSLLGMRSDDYLILHAPDGDRVYDLRRDPGQTEPLPASHPAYARARHELEAEVSRALSLRPAHESPGPPVLDAETERRLEALGYRDPEP